MKNMYHDRSNLSMTRFHLLQKTELKIEGILLQKSNLNDIAAVVAYTLGMQGDSVFVSDLRDNTMTLDIIKDSVNADDILGKKDELLQRLANLPGISINENTLISSNGVLGWIALDDRKARRALKRSRKMAEEVRQRLSKRAIVFSTGFEVAAGQVKDTNTAIIAQRLEAEGYLVTRGSTLNDDELLIAGKLRQAIYDDGYGLVITTGGVGAEDKDCTIEAMLTLDPDAATPYICKYQKGAGRHYKDGVKIGVGQVAGALIVALPGPNNEVKSSVGVLSRLLKSDLDKYALAKEIAENLRTELQMKMKHKGREELNKEPWSQ